MLNMLAEINGKTTSDLLLALDEMKRKVMEGYTLGTDSNDDGGYSFSVTGDEECGPQEDDDAKTNA